MHEAIISDFMISSSTFHHWFVQVQWNVRPFSKLKERFQDWVAECHAKLDRETAFSNLVLDKSSPAKLVFRTLTFGQPKSDQERAAATLNAGDRVAIGGRSGRKGIQLGEVVHFAAIPASDFPAAALQADLLYQGVGVAMVQRMPFSVWPLSNSGLVEVDVGRLDPSVVRLSKTEWSEEMAKKEKELPAELRVRHLPLNEAACPSDVAGEAPFLKPGLVLGDGRVTQLEAGLQEITLVVAILNGFEKVVTKQLDDSKKNWVVCQSLYEIPEDAGSTNAESMKRKFRHVNSSTYSVPVQGATSQSMTQGGKSKGEMSFSFRSFDLSIAGRYRLVFTVLRSDRDASSEAEMLAASQKSAAKSGSSSGSTGDTNTVLSFSHVFDVRPGQPVKVQAEWVDSNEEDTSCTAMTVRDAGAASTNGPKIRAGHMLPAFRLSATDNFGNIAGGSSLLELDADRVTKPKRGNKEPAARSNQPKATGLVPLKSARVAVAAPGFSVAFDGKASNPQDYLNEGPLFADGDVITCGGGSTANGGGFTVTPAEVNNAIDDDEATLGGPLFEGQIELSLSLGEGTNATLLHCHLPLTVYPGVPESLRRLDDNIGSSSNVNSSQIAALRIGDGESLPALRFGVFDAWGYRTAPRSTPAEVTLPELASPAGKSSSKSKSKKKGSSGSVAAAKAKTTTAAGYVEEEKWDVVVEMDADGQGLTSATGATSRAISNADGSCEFNDLRLELPREAWTSDTADYASQSIPAALHRTLLAKLRILSAAGRSSTKKNASDKHNASGLDGGSGSEPVAEVPLEVTPSNKPARIVVYIGEAPNSRIVGSRTTTLNGQTTRQDRRNNASSSLPSSTASSSSVSASSSSSSANGESVSCVAGGTVQDLEVRVLDAFDRPWIIKDLAHRNLEDGAQSKSKDGAACLSLSQGGEQKFGLTWQETLTNATQDEEADLPDMAVYLPDLVQSKKFKDTARVVSYQAVLLFYFLANSLKIV